MGLRKQDGHFILGLKYALCLVASVCKPHYCMRDIEKIIRVDSLVVFIKEIGAWVLVKYYSEKYVMNVKVGV